MKCMSRNKVKFFYALYEGKTPITDDYGNVTYDKVIVMDKDAPPIDEYSVLWVDNKPQTDENGNLAVNEKGEIITPHDYIVKKVAKSLNVVSMAISKVSVS